MTQTMTQRPTVAARRMGYVVGALVNVALLYAVDIWPGWEVVPFLTAEAASVLVLVNLSIVTNLAANAVYLVYDEAWLKALGSILTTTVGMITLVRIWQVFPFDFGGSSINWQLVTRFLLIIGIVGSDIGIIVAFIALVKSFAARNN
jgi:hypothetical protein